MSVPASIASFRVPKVFHRTWAGTFQCKPQAYFQPSNLEEIQSLVNEARIQKKTLMTVGSGHSPSDLTMTNEWLVNLDKFNQVLSVKPHSSGKYTDVTVEAGIRIYQLNDYLKAKNLAIQNLGSISEQSIAGIISTGTHGSSPFHGLVSQQIVDLTLVNSKGDLIKCSSEENTSLFKAALLSLGKIGLIVQATIRTIPRYQIKSNQEIIELETLLKHWDTLWTTDEFIRCWWFPYTEKCVLWRASKTTEPLSEPRSSWYGTPFGRYFYESLLWISVNVFPRLTPYVESFVFHQQYGRVETLGNGDYAVQGSVEGLNMDCLFSQFVNEWTAPLTEGVSVLRKLDAEIKKAAANGDYYVHAPMEVRCSNTTNSNLPGALTEEYLSNRDLIAPGPVPGSNLRPFLDTTPKLTHEADLSKVTNEQLTLYINATMYRPFHSNVKINKWYTIFEDIMGEVGGKPHWAKNFIGFANDSNSGQINDEKYQLDFGGKKDYKMFGFKNQMSDWFDKDLEEFKQVRREMDPDGVFLSGKQWALRNGIIEGVEQT